MDFNKRFLEDEVRLGFYIPSTIKQAWAAELEVLQAIKDVCEKYSLRFYADWGSFLGAVRHKGFIPWDDDMDIVMLREDYDRFLEVAPKALPKGYSVRTFRNQDNFVEFHAVVLNSEQARFDEEFYEQFHGFPYQCGVDIFVLDFVHADEEMELDRIRDTTYIIAFADAMLEKSINRDSLDCGYKKIERMFNVKFDRSKSDRELWVELYEFAEKKCAEVTSANSNVLIQMVPWGLKHLMHCRYPYEEFSESVDIPFEYTTVPVPPHFNRVLSQHYGDYMKIIKNAGMHNYPFFMKQKCELEELFGHTIFEYSYIPASQNHENGNQWKPVIIECLESISSMIEIVEEKLTRQDESLGDTICSLQELVIDLGNFIESIKGEGHSTIKLIENFAEQLYELYVKIPEVPGDGSLAPAQIQDSSNAEFNEVSRGAGEPSPGTFGTFNSFKEMESAIKTQIINKKEVVFLPFKADYWDAMKGLYEYYAKQDMYDVYVVPIPYYYKKYDGTLTDEQYDIDAYPKEICPIDYTKFSLEYHHPDIIVMQNPYDNYNVVTSVHPEMYSDKLHNHTDKLIYIPWFNTYDFTEENKREYSNMRYYVTMPGVVNADIVYLNSEILRETYIRKLTEFAGEDTQNIWEKKIAVLDEASPKSPNSLLAQKTILYYIGQSHPIENPNEFIDKLKRNLNIFKKSKENINLIFLPDKNIKSSIERFEPQLKDKYEKVLEEYTRNGYEEYGEDFSEDLIKECDAFYGDAGYIATLFSNAKKPVMIQNYEC